MNFEDLIEIANILLGENGCPWDKKQTYKSLRNYLIEESYELTEAIDEDDFELIKEELGDVLYNIVFISKLAEKDSKFTIYEVVDNLCVKLKRRHPHIFSNIKLETEDQVVEQWKKIKMNEKKRENIFENIPKTFPSIMRAQKICKKCKITTDKDLSENELCKKLFELSCIAESKNINLERSFLKFLFDKQNELLK